MSSSATSPTLQRNHQKTGPDVRERRKKSENGSILWLGLIPLLIFVPWWTIRAHYYLPTPKVALFDAHGRPQLSEARILNMVTELTDPHYIGFRTVGSREHALGDAWAVQQVQDLVGLCNYVKAQAATDGRTLDLECDWDRQQGSGMHKFDIMNQVIYKSYQNLTNILFRISSSQPESKSLALLVNAHLDSSLPTPGAADDALSVGIILEAARVLIESVGRGQWEVGWSIILLINNAEESFQDASHLFSTQHPWAQNVRTVMNLEAAGSKGPELLFQATSEEMVYVYQGVPYPYGTVLANDIFSSGILMSDTDFRQFDQYLRTPGIDMAVVGHSYFYHSTRDVVENIEPGVAQHFGENVLSLMKQMTSRPRKANGEYENDSLMQRIRKFEETLPDQDQLNSKDSPKSTSSASSAATLPVANTSPFASAGKGGQQHSRRPDLVFFTLFGMKPLVYSGLTAKILYTVWALFCSFMTAVSLRKQTDNPASEKAAKSTSTSSNGGTHLTIRLVIGSMASIIFSLIRSILYANGVAFIMRTVLSKQLSWFAGEWRPVALYASPVLLGLISPPFKFLIPRSAPDAVCERALVHGALLLNAFLAVAIQLAGIGSAVMPLLISLGVGSGVASGIFLEWLFKGLGEARRVHAVVYLIGSILPLAAGVELAVGTLDVFVPLTGRMPPFVPAEHIIATLVAVFLYIPLPLLPALAYRVPFSGTTGSHSIANRANLRQLLRLGCVLAIAWFAFLSGWGSWPFDPMHPKRIFVSLSESLPSGEIGVHVAGMDGAAGFPALVQGLSHVAGAFNQKNATNGGIQVPEKIEFHQWNSNWGPFHPLGALLDHYSLVSLPNLTPGGELWRENQSFGVIVVDDRLDDGAGTRSLKLEMRHTGVIWTMLEFDAHVLSWSIDDSPPDGYTRHRIKEASFYGTNTWTLDITIGLDPDVHESMQRPSGALTPRNEAGRGALHLTYSGMVEKEMWPGKKWQWEEEKNVRARQGIPEPEGTVMEFFERISTWMEKEKSGSTDLFMMHTIVKDIVI